MPLNFDKNAILHPKELVITDFLRETVSFNQEKVGSLGSGEKMSEELELFFRNEIIK